RRLLIHHSQRGEAGRQLPQVPGFLLLVSAEVADDVARDRNVGFVAVLLEEQPLQDLCTFETRRRQERRALCEVVEDGIGLGQVDGGFDRQQRKRAVRGTGWERR